MGTKCVDPFLVPEEDRRYIVSLNPLNYGALFTWSAGYGYELATWTKDVAEKIVKEMNSDLSHGKNYKPYKVITPQEYVKYL